MASGGGRTRADYDYLIKLLLIGDSGMSTLRASIYKAINFLTKGHTFTHDRVLVLLLRVLRSRYQGGLGWAPSSHSRDRDNRVSNDAY